MPHLPRMTKSAPIHIRRLIADLERWAEQPGGEDETVGDAAMRGQKAWLWAKHGNQLMHLNADTTRKGIREFVVQLKSSNALSAVPNDKGPINKVIVTGQNPIPGFYLYLDAPLVNPKDLGPP